MRCPYCGGTGDMDSREGRAQRAKRVIERSREMGVSQDDLAVVSGLCKWTVSKIFSGVTSAPHMSSIQALEGALDRYADDRSA